MNAFYARPHPLWKTTEDGGPVVVDGKLQAELDANGNAIVRAYTVAIGDGKPLETKLSSAPPIPWVKFKLKRDCEAFCSGYKPPTLTRK